MGPRLRRAGFAVEHVETLTILNPRLHEDTYSHGIIGLIRSFVARRDMQAAEAEAWEAELRELGRGTSTSSAWAGSCSWLGGPSHSGSSPRERDTLMASARRMRV